MIYTQEQREHDTGKRGRTPRSAFWIAAFVAAAGTVGGWLYQIPTEDEEVAESEPAAIYCPQPPCTLIIVNGIQRCVYANNHTKLCP